MPFSRSANKKTNGRGRVFSSRVFILYIKLRGVFKFIYLGRGRRRKRASPASHINFSIYSPAFGPEEKKTLDQPLTFISRHHRCIIFLPIILHFIFYPIAFHHASYVSKKHQQHLNFTHKWLLLPKIRRNAPLVVVGCITRR